MRNLVDSRHSKTSVVAIALALLGFAQPALAASCMELETQLNGKLEEYGAWSQVNAGGSVCVSMERLAALMEEAIVLHEQCGAEVDPTGEQLIGYRDTLLSIRQGQQQLCNG